MALNRDFCQRGREHNLKNIDVDIPETNWWSLPVFPVQANRRWLSIPFMRKASGATSNLSAYARQFLGQMEKPDVDYIEGLSPAISIDQKTTSKNPRSTVGTITEIYDYLRVNSVGIGEPYCYQCRQKIASQSVQEIVELVSGPAGGSAAGIVWPPGWPGRKGRTWSASWISSRRGGFVRVRVNGEFRELEEEKIRLGQKKEAQHRGGSGSPECQAGTKVPVRPTRWNWP